MAIRIEKPKVGKSAAMLMIMVGLYLYGKAERTDAQIEMLYRMSK